MTIARKMYLVLAVLVCILLVRGWMAHSSAIESKQQIDAVRDNAVGAVTLADAQSALWELRYGFPQFIIGDPAARAKIVETEPKLRARVEADFKAYGALRLSPEERKAFEELKAAFAKYMDARPRWFQLFGEGKLDEAAAWRAQTTTPFGAAAVKAFSDQIELQKAGSERRQAAATEVIDQSRTATLVFTVIATLAAVAAMVWLMHGILTPLGALRAATEDLRSGEGDLTRRLPETTGELGELSRSLNGFVEKLQTVIRRVKVSSGTVNQAALEIAAGNAELSSRTEQQASALEETAASMEEMTATVSQNAENAKKANELASQASGLAVQGGVAVREVVDTMEDITQSSKKISDIIGVIDGIAFQTNILALNAAVEAARAGEQGRGFAVVASEVRSLAQRSAAAAKEIKGLINESVGRVETGSRQVDAAGSKIEEVVGAVKRVTNLIAEIAAASQEQSQGIIQVSETVTQLEKVTQQNAAMVEEASAAAGSLEEQSGRLSEAIGVFKVDLESGHGALHAQPVPLPASPASAPAPVPASVPLPKAPRTAAELPAPTQRRSAPTGDAKGEGWEHF